MFVLVDTCVILDVIHKRKDYYKDSLEIFSLAANERIMAYITANTITDIYYLSYKAFHGSLKAKKCIEDLIKIFGVLDTTKEDVINAISSPMKDYEDAILSEIADREDIDLIITRNVKDFKKSKVPVKTPKDFIENRYINFARVKKA